MRRITAVGIGLVANTFTQPALATGQTGAPVTTELAATAFWTVNDPFVGKWMLDVPRSTIVDEMRVEALASNRYGFDFEGAPTEVIVADGTDQPGLPGTTLSVKFEDAGTLTVVRKQGGRIIVKAIWKLAQNGRTLHDAFMSQQPDGSRVTVDYVYRRMSEGSGFAGVWESTTKPVGLKLELAIQPYDSNGLSFVSPGSRKSVIFDGREHPAPDDSVTLSGLRSGPRLMEFSEKKGSKVERGRRFELSHGGRTLTETLHTAGQTTPDVLVFERE